MFGAPVALGRTFTAQEDSPNGGHFVVLNYGLWKSRYGGNKNVIGSTMQIDGQPYMIVGVIVRVSLRTRGRSWIPFNSI